MKSFNYFLFNYFLFNYFSSLFLYLALLFCDLTIPQHIFLLFILRTHLIHELLCTFSTICCSLYYMYTYLSFVILYVYLIVSFLLYRYQYLIVRGSSLQQFKYHVYYSIQNSSTVSQCLAIIKRIGSHF